MSAAAAETPAPIPVTVIGGYLGAGKTTLVNHLLWQARGLRLAVLVNDFGALPIDADLIEAQDGNVVSIAGGCVCCSYGSDLIAALMQMAQMRPRVDHVLIETSGVALPGQVAAALTLLVDYTTDAVVTLVDAGSVRRLAQDRYLADTITRQLADAHLVILNKCDLVPEAEQAELAQWLAVFAPGARCVPARHGVVPLTVVLGQRLVPSASGVAPPEGGEHAHVHDTAAYETRAFEVTQVQSATALATALQDPTLGLLRAKGIVAEPDGRAYVVQLAGGRVSVTPAPPGQIPRGLVVIGLKGQVDMDRVASEVLRSRSRAT